MKVQDIFRVERAKLNKTSREVAKLIGTSAMYISQSEDIRKTVISTKTDTCKKLCELYGLDSEKICKMIQKQKLEEGIARIKEGQTA